MGSLCNSMRFIESLLIKWLLVAACSLIKRIKIKFIIEKF